MKHHLPHVVLRTLSSCGRGSSHAGSPEDAKPGRTGHRLARGFRRARRWATLRLPHAIGAWATGVALCASQLAAQPARTEPTVWVNYDFVPGNRVIYFADYGDDRVGNFPQRLTFRSGNMEIAEVDGQRFIRVTGSSVLGIPLPEVLPPRFTIEIDVINRKVLDGAAFRLPCPSRPI